MLHAISLVQMIQKENLLTTVANRIIPQAGLNTSAFHAARVEFDDPHPASQPFHVYRSSSCLDRVQSTASHIRYERTPSTERACILPASSARSAC